MKPLKFVGSSFDDVKNFPEEARRIAGFELRAIQDGFEPRNWKPIQVVGAARRKFGFASLVNDELYMSPN